MQKNVFWKICISILRIALCLVSAVQGYAETTQSSTSSSPQILWWYDLQAPSFGSSATGDIDNDGKLEIVFGTYFNDENVYALNAENGSLLWSYNTGGCNDASPAIADVDLDGYLEVIIPASSPSMVYCFNGTTGQVKWSRPTGSSNCIDSPPAVADVDNDNKPEVVFGTFHGYVFCLNGEDGSICWQINLGTNSYIQSCPNILDINGDQKLDIVVAQWNGDHRIYALYGENGSTKWYCSQPQDWMYHGGSFADIDEDGKDEIAIGCYDNHVYVINSEDGSPVWNYLASSYVGAPTSIADLNNDNHLEIVFVSYNIIGVLSHTGSLLWSYSVGGNIFRGAAIADINGDGTLDVAFGAEDGKVRVLSGDTGQVIWTIDLQAHYGMVFDIDHAPVIADFNNDGKLDLFIVGGYGIASPETNNYGRAYMLSAGDGGNLGWSMFRHDLRHSACYSENQIPDTPTTPSGPSWLYNGESGIFSTNAVDPDNNRVQYRFDWNASGVHDYSNWTSLVFSGQSANMSHSWTLPGTYVVKAQARDEYGAMSIWSDPLSITIIQYGPPPSPPIIDGPTHGKIGVAYNYTFVAVNPDANDVFYWIEWGDDSPAMEWVGPYLAGQWITINHTFAKKGTYTIKAKVKEIFGIESDWATLKVSMPKTEFLSFNAFLQHLPRKFPNVFPLLRCLFGY
jgi:outer membrane protein assembly factor BamB